MKAFWTVLSADANGKPTCRMWRLPRLGFGALTIWHERGLYSVLRAERGALRTTGFSSRTLRGALEQARALAPVAVEQAPVTAVVDPLVAKCAQLFARGYLLGSRVSAGRWCPAVADEYSWCVLNLQGSPLWLGYDPVAALASFEWWEALSDDEFAEWSAMYGGEPCRDRTADALERNAFEERRYDLELRGYLRGAA